MGKYPKRQNDDNTNKGTTSSNRRDQLKIISDTLEHLSILLDQIAEEDSTANQHLATSDHTTVSVISQPTASYNEYCMGIHIISVLTYLYLITSLVVFNYRTVSHHFSSYLTLLSLGISSFLTVSHPF
ncbi:hypothetical protein EB796_014468 [Bugula neritina]|uniref:Uncharacterized protein n=1 Tax=Bugula neritina TaxID=10212 RepID=A0A7J7JLS5_BUGNE|nr:hypothetical protein EB796_014468 [Bugula neritina]